MREIVLDTETTGLDPAQGHRMVEVGCIEIINKVRTGKYFHAYINPERSMPAEAERVHGLSGSFLADKPRFAEIADALLEFLGAAPLVIHNAAFDMKFLRAELARLEHVAQALENAAVVDTLKIAREKFPGSPANLDALCRRFEVDLSARTQHGALLDAELLAEVYLELCGGRQTALQLGKTSISTSSDADRPNNQRTPVPMRQFAPSAEEQAAHAQLIESLVDPLWKAYKVG